jgi:hypothetical protein
MKFALLFFVICVAESAFATKARMISLNYSLHLFDEQLMFTNPIYINYLDKFVSLESGTSDASSAATSTSNAEGIVSGRIGNNNVAAAIGHQNETVLRTRSFINSFGYTYRLSQNPLHLFWGGETDEANYAVEAFYSAYHDKFANEKEDGAGLTLEVELGAWQLIAGNVLTNKVETPTMEFNGSGNIFVQASYIGDNIEAYANFVREPVKSLVSGIETEFHILQFLKLGIVDSNSKEMNDIFWGAEINTVKVDCRVRGATGCDQAFVGTTLPVWIGIEAQALQWLKLRSSVKQTAFVNQSRDDVGYPADAVYGATGSVSEYLNGPNTTSVSLGAGLTLRKLTLDGTFVASTSQKINGTDFLNQLSIKYSF